MKREIFHISRNPHIPKDLDILSETNENRMYALKIEHTYIQIFSIVTCYILNRKIGKDEEEERQDGGNKEELSPPTNIVRIRPCRNQADCRNRAQCVNTRVPRFTQSVCKSKRAFKPLFIETTKMKYKWKSRKVEGQEESTLRPQFSLVCRFSSIRFPLSADSFLDVLNIYHDKPFIKKGLVLMILTLTYIIEIIILSTFRKF